MSARRCVESMGSAMRESARVSIQVSLTAAPPGTASTKVRSKVALCARTGLPATKSASAATAVRASGAPATSMLRMPVSRSISLGMGTPGSTKVSKRSTTSRAAHARGGDLDQLAVLEREARGLRVEHDHVLLERAKVGRARTLGEAQVAGANVGGRPRKEEPLERRGVVSAHALVVRLGCLERILHEPGAELGELDPAVAGRVGQQALGRHSGDGVGLQDHRRARRHGR